MANIRAITGINQVLANIKRRTGELGKGFSRGVRVAGLRLQRESQRLVPVNFGVLKNSAFTRANGTGLRTEVNVGYSAHYAIYVHEAIEMKLKGQPRKAKSKGKGYQGHYWDPQGRAQAKFLEEPARRLASEMRNIIRDHMKIK